MTRSGLPGAARPATHGPDLAIGDGADHGAPCRLEGLIACGQVFSFHWHDGFWVPLFQLDRRLQAARPGLVQVLAKLGGVLDGWELAVWFVWPNARLGGHLPIEHFASHWPDVVNAARAEPCVASG